MRLELSSPAKVAGARTRRRGCGGVLACCEYLSQVPIFGIIRDLISYQDIYEKLHAE